MLGFGGSNLQAGSGTTAVALRTIMHQIMKDPVVVFRTREELEAPGLKHFMPFREAFNDFLYVKAVIQEALRIHPPFALLFERSLPASELSVSDETLLPMDTKVGIFGYTMHLDKEVFGEDTDTFKPDRWLQQFEEDDGQCQARLRRMRSLYMASGQGQKDCIGVHVAELQIYELTPALVGLLDVCMRIVVTSQPTSRSPQSELVDPENKWRVQQRFFSLQSNMGVRIRWRPGCSLEDLAIRTLSRFESIDDL